MAISLVPFLNPFSLINNYLFNQYLLNAYEEPDTDLGDKGIVRKENQNNHHVLLQSHLQRAINKLFLKLSVDSQRSTWTVLGSCFPVEDFSLDFLLLFFPSLYPPVRTHPISWSLCGCLRAFSCLGSFPVLCNTQPQGLFF